MAGRLSPCHINMGATGEGNYASTEFSYTRERETDRGLTPQPKIQSNDGCLFGAMESLSDADLDALLGPVQFDLDLPGVDSRKDDAWLYDLFNAHYQLPEPSSKKRKFTAETSKEHGSGQHPTSSVDLGDSVCITSFHNSVANTLEEQPTRNLSSKLSFPSFPERHSSNNGLIRVGCPSDQSIRSSDYLDKRPSRGSDTPGGRTKLDSILPSSSSFSGLCQEYEQTSHDPIEDGAAYIVDNLNCGSEVDSWNSNDGSLSEGDGQELAIDESAAIGNVPSIAQETQSTGPLCSHIQRVDHYTPVESVDGNSPPCNQKESNIALPKYISRKAALEFGFQKGLFSLDNNRAATSTSPGAGSQSEDHHFAAGQRNNKQNFLTPPNLKPLLPLSIAFAIAQPSHHRSILRTVLDSFNPAAPGHIVPEQLRGLFDSLERKLNHDKEFQKSTFTYLASKMASSYSGESSEQDGKSVLHYP
jgi:hypothetical protein